MEKINPVFRALRQIEIDGIKAESYLLEKTEKLIEKVKLENIECVFFLDRSARPLAHYFLKMWNQTQRVRPPKIKFINIGRETKPSIFIKRDTNYLIRLKKDIVGVKSKFLVVDEISETRDTKLNVKTIFSEIFPNFEYEYYPMLQANSLKQACKGDFRLYLLVLERIFPWYKNKDKYLLVEDINRENSEGEYIVDLFSKPVGTEIDRRVGLNLRDKIKRIFQKID